MNSLVVCEIQSKSNEIFNLGLLKNLDTGNVFFHLKQFPNMKDFLVEMMGKEYNTCPLPTC
jgi:hypothetical protein